MTRSLILAILCAISAMPQLFGSDGDRWLARLDDALARYPEYIARREAAIDSVRRLDRLTPFEHEMAMTQAFMSYSLDSAMTHSLKAVALAADKAELNRAKMGLTLLYVTSGVMYKEAAEVYGSLDTGSLEREGLMFNYYSLGVQLYRNLAAHSLDKGLREEYLARKVAYRDSALTLQPDNDILLANRYIDNGDYRRAIDMLRTTLTDGLTTRDAAVKYNVLAQVYALQGNREAQRDYLAQSAVCDITNGVREYLSLQDLAMLLYTRGDYERAYRYIHQSINDATACNAKLRMLEMSESLPIIDAAREREQRRSRNVLFIFAGLITLLSLALVAMLLAKRKHAKRLAMAYAAQQELNETLSVSDRIKEEYIKRFMNLSLEYLARMESYRRNLLRLSNTRNLDEMRDAIKSSRYIDKGVSDFYRHFDDAFLSLFPTFLEDLRGLLAPDYAFNLKKGERLNTELRILALTRLGITDGESICRFLRCSASTVYNYRTKIRNHALNRDTFEADLMKIGKLA